MPPIRILIADDHQIFRSGLAQALQCDPQIECVAQAADGNEVLDRLADHPVDIAVLDLKMPQLDGLAAAELIRMRFPDVRVLLLTSYDDPAFLAHSIRIGVAGYLLKNSDVQTIVEALHQIRDTGHYISEFVARATVELKEQLETPGRRPAPTAFLTDKERMIVRLISEELTTAEIGDKLFLSPRSVERIRMQLLERTGTKNMVGLVMYCLRNGLLTK